MDLSKYDALGAAAPAQLIARYQQLREELQRLCASPKKDMVAIDAVVVELDEVQAAAKDAQKREGDQQRF